MKISVQVAPITTYKAPMLAIPSIGSLSKDSLFLKLDTTLRKWLYNFAQEEGFKGKSNQILLISASSKFKSSRVYFMGCEGITQQTARHVRTFAYRASRLAREKGFSDFAIVVPEIPKKPINTIVQWIAEGAHSGNYRYSNFFTGDRKPKKEPEKCTIVIPEEYKLPLRQRSTKIKRSLEKANHAAEGIQFARDLVNTPSNHLTPLILASEAQKMAHEVGLKALVFDSEKIQDIGMNLLYAVGKGGHNPPYFIHLTYKPSRKKIKGEIALVGKGITFDSGGLSLKTVKGQYDMKCDMAGAATVLGAIKAAALSKSPYVIHAIIPAAENIPGAQAIHPGDVIKGMNGKSVEIQNTDAEGRLILADALSYATNLEPDVIIDFATLTGACLVALGQYRAGLFGSQEEWAEQYLTAAKAAGEPIWRLPLAKELKENLRSSTADLRNIGGLWGGTITAALFLQEFVKKQHWLHIDIAGPAYLDKPFSFYPRGGTGYGILTILEILTPN